MDILSATSAVTADQSKATLASNKLSDDFDNFLTLLTTQLQNQDPLEPMDSNEFTQQLVQFTEVEQSIATNKNLEQILTSLCSAKSSKFNPLRIFLLCS